MTYGWYKLVIGIREQKYVWCWSNAHIQKPLRVLSPPQKSAALEGGNQADLTNSLRSEYAREKMWSRIHLIPLLQAEEDRDLVRRHLADQAREKELLGENIKVYHSDRLAPLPFVIPL